MKTTITRLNQLSTQALKKILKLNSNNFSSTAPTKVDVNRVKWENKANINKMYNILYK